MALAETQQKVISLTWRPWKAFGIFPTGRLELVRLREVADSEKPDGYHFTLRATQEGIDEQGLIFKAGVPDLVPVRIEPTGVVKPRAQFDQQAVAEIATSWGSFFKTIEAAQAALGKMPPSQPA